MVTASFATKNRSRMTGAWLLFQREEVFRSRWQFNFLRGQAIEDRILVRQRRTLMTGDS